MRAPEWLRPGLYGAVAGAVALAVVGFSWGGWVIGSKADEMAASRSQTDVAEALSLICVDQSKRDPLLDERLALLKAAASYSRADLVMKNGWATMPGSVGGNRRVAVACADKVGA